MTEIKKLELKHIAPYLPYGLKVQASWSIDGFGGLCTLKAVGIYHEELLLEPHTILHKHIPYRISIDRASLDDPDTKPLLRPMSDLYKERNGEVRIMKVAKLLGLDSSDVELHPLEDSLLIRDDWYDNMFRWCPINKTFIDSDNEIFLKLEAIEYLFSNHYDVFGLIEQGLAINKNDIE